MHSNPDPERTLGDVVRYGVVREVTYDPPRVTVAVGDLLTHPIPWGAVTWGALRLWAPPSEGQQVVLICPEGDIAAAHIGHSLAQDAMPLAGPKDGRFRLEHDDGFAFEYDPGAKLLRLAPADGGATRIEGPLTVAGALTVEQTLTVEQAITGQYGLKLTGDATVSGDVKAGTVSLKGHIHTGVQTGGGLSGAPKP